MADTAPYNIVVYGLISDVNFHIAKCCAEDLHLKNGNAYLEPVIEGMMEFDWDIFLENKKKELRGETWEFSEPSLITINGTVVGGPSDFLKWAEEKHYYFNFRPMPLYDLFAEKAYKSHINAKNRDYVYMDMAIGEQPAGRLVFELFTEMLPRTCDNFRQLCTGSKGNSETTEYPLHYKGSIFHRVVKNGWIQGGDIWLKRGDGGESIFGPVFEDESFAVKHLRRGILGMANKGKHTNGSQFYITLQPSKWMDTKYVAFGNLVEGTNTLKAMEEQQTQNERPHQEMRIQDCGILKFEF